ncbi:MAG: type II CAAX endopeptidase family protein [Candidatus Omnitrophota bacterium]|nr:type II CAAX endopeptidase family protein [Candidatus Omnitrophota bacterium]
MTHHGYKIPVTGRFAVSIAAIAAPLLLLAFGVYGSFSFTFSIPLVWQIGILGEGLRSLGLKRRSLWPSITAGILTGLIIAFFGGFILRALGMTCYHIDRAGEINNFLQSFGLRISFQGELGFRLLTAGNELIWVFSSLIFSIFLVGLGEEIFWRGFIQRKISKALPKNASIWITAVLFSLVHFYIFFIIPFKEGLFLLGLIALTGAIWGYLYEYFGNIWGPALSHGITAFLVWRYFVFS